MSFCIKNKEHFILKVSDTFLCCLFVQQPNCIKYISQVNDCKGEMDPICGTNGRTYPNICVFCSELFAASGAFTFSHYGKCAA
uniref:Kazal-like domain-containing protein n=1 Tax=Suricata suricatta TaxID=37032 RepID=A0A673SZ61_SURSU